MDSFTLLPLTIDKVTNAVLAPSSTPSHPALPDAISDLNTLHRSMLQFENAIPPPPGLVNPKRSAQINKLRESGNAAFRKQAFGEAVKLYSLALEMCLGRPHWEQSALVREESAMIYSNRSQANITMRNWAEGMCDAEMSCALKPKDNVKAWYRRALCLKEMGKLEDSREVLEMGCEWEAENQGKTDGDLRALLRDVHKAIEEKEKIVGAA
ncbi:hypothetical protein TWF225_006838 [Orbilia oligospora]|uniref:Uncharacterized protein n=1 Tax=Orbilia oligospora TaxID=2813651 RepID=A0A7C8U815_ORBOL|nr:hypothetical protein TWF751_008425 [Orbilia oligospora]KAF3194285.1 hypothetical protein TWF225_006838 [Orbilia oligospora]KAF3235626.1 hypothetical protein TWF217_003097 [Orbilia oligospora]KAF3240777.1 hypothetical protein TWF128_011201 [Orbilia oligospora]KAF3296214.1 hypothetical protein TWF132_011673 [Orbilia oligospora]